MALSGWRDTERKGGREGGRGTFLLRVSTGQALEEERSLPHPLFVAPQLLRRRRRWEGGGGIGSGEGKELFEHVSAWREGGRGGGREGWREG